MKVLFLTNNLEVTNSLIDWIKSDENDVVISGERALNSTLSSTTFDIIISYNYRHIVSSDIIERYRGKMINMHISFLPWNRGANPNFWSFIDDTPKGVSIHYIDERVDSGDLIAQKELFFDNEKETLESSYRVLHQEMQALFKQYWESIKKGLIKRSKQSGEGSFHYAKEFDSKKKGLGDNIFELKLSKLIERYNSIYEN